MNIKEREEVEKQYQKQTVEHSFIVTVFLTSSNREEYIGKAIESILGQTYKEFCFVILDNNSTDKTKEIIESYNRENLFFIQRSSTRKDPNYKYAFSICNTKYMVVFHDDDIVESNYLTTMINKMEEDENIKLLSPSAIMIDDTDNIILTPPCVPGEYCGSSYFEHFINRDNKVSIWFPAIMYRTSYYKNVDAFFNGDEAGPATDKLVLLQTERYGGKIEVLQERLFRYRIHTKQDSCKNAGIMELKLLNYLKKDDYYRDLLVKNKDNEYRYLLGAYKALIINYKNNRDWSIRKWFKLDKCLYKNAKGKNRIIYSLYSVSYYFFPVIIIPCAQILRLKDE